MKMVVRKMKEKCKDAARMRREKERAEFIELSKLLPLPSSTTSQLDKASIIRLTSSYLRMRAAFPEGLGTNWGTRKLTSSSSQSNYNARVASSDNDIVSRQHQARTSDDKQQQQQQSGVNEHQSLRNLVNRPLDQHLYSNQNQHRQQTHIKELGSLILQTLDGFVFALHRDGKIMYISETASVLLGLPQIDLTGSSIFDYVHPADHNDLLNMLSLDEADRHRIQIQLESSSGLQSITSTSDVEHLELNRSFSMRMKCILPKRNAGLIQNGYKSIHCTGYLKVRRVRQHPSNHVLDQSNGVQSHQAAASCVKTTMRSMLDYPENKNCPVYASEPDWDSYALVAVGHSLLPTASTEIKLNTTSFMFRANLDLKIYYMEAPAIYSLGHKQDSVVGQSLYQLVHLADSQHLEETHRLLLSKGQVVSKYFRLMRRDGGYLWVQMQATLINNPRSVPRPLHIVGICIVIGDNQMDQSQLLLNEPTSTNLNESCSINSSIVGQSDRASQRGKIVKTRSGTNSLLTVKSDAKILANNYKRTGIKRRDKAILPIKRIKPQNGNTNTVKCKIFDENTNSSHSSMLQTRQDQSMIGDRACVRQSLSMDQRYNQTIGSMRRSSDDTCSVASSSASASTIPATIMSNAAGTNMMSCALSSTSSCSSASSNCSSSSLSAPVESSTMQSVDPHQPDKFHPVPPSRLLNSMGAPTHDNGSLSQLQHYQPQCFPSTASDVGQIYLSHNQPYQANNYWPLTIDNSKTHYPSESRVNYMQLTAENSHLPSEQYYYNLDEHHIEGDNQLMSYYQCGNNCMTFYNGPQNFIGPELISSKFGAGDRGVVHPMQYQYHNPIDEHQPNNESTIMAATTVTPACFIETSQSF